MMELIGIPPQVLFGQLLLGLINGAFYAMLSLGLALIFGLLNIQPKTYWRQLLFLDQQNYSGIQVLVGLGEG